MQSFIKSIYIICICVVLAAGLTLTGCQPSSDGASDRASDSSAEGTTPASAVPAGQLGTDVRPLAYDIHLILDPEADTFFGEVDITVSLDTPQDVIYLHSEFSQVERAQATLADGTTLPAIFTNDLAAGGVSSLSFEAPLPAGTANLQISYSARYNFGLAGLYKVTQAGRGYLATQMEPIDARKMFPSFDDPQFKTPFTTRITAPVGQTVLTNGPLERVGDAETDRDGYQTHYFKTTRAIPTYLVAVAVGPYEAFEAARPLPANAVRPDALDFRAFAPVGKAPKLESAVDVTAQMLNWQEAYFDTPYPYQKLDIIAAPDFAYGAMENAGLIIYREQALLIDNRTTLSRQYGIFTIHAHELAHQWFGNLVTPKWWDDIWLNEAFATWMAYKTMHGVFPELGYDRNAVRSALGAMNVDQLASTRQIRNPITSNADIEDAFDAITYRKGGGVLNMFETYLGQDAFRSGVRTHMQRFKDEVADVDDFMESLAQGSGNDNVVESFRSFIFQPGIPFVELDISCGTREEGWQLGLKQSRFAPPGSAIDADAQTWVIPFSARWGNRAVASQTEQVLFAAPASSTPVAGACPLWIMPNAKGTGYWRFDLSEAWWDKLIRAYTTLTATEKLMMNDSLNAAFLRGSIPVDMWQRGMELTAREGPWDTRRQPLSKILAAIDYIDSPKAEVAYRAWATDIWQPLYKQLNNRGEDISVGDALLRDRLGQFLAELNGSADPEEDLAGLAAQFVGLNGDAKPDALKPAALEAGIKAGYKTHGTAFLDAALALAKATTNQGEQSNILSALAKAANPEDLTNLSDVVFGPEKPFKGREIYVFARAMMQNDDQDAAWSIFTTRFDTVAQSVPKIRRPALAGLVGAFCDVERANIAKAFFEDNAAALPGLERRLAQGFEAANLCAAAKEQVGPKLDAFFAPED